MASMDGHRGRFLESGNDLISLFGVSLKKYLAVIDTCTYILGEKMHLSSQNHSEFVSLTFRLAHHLQPCNVRHKQACNELLVIMRITYRALLVT